MIIFESSLFSVNLLFVLLKLRIHIWISTFEIINVYGKKKRVQRGRETAWDWVNEGRTHSWKPAISQNPIHRLPFQGPLNRSLKTLKFDPEKTLSFQLSYFYDFDTESQ